MMKRNLRRRGIEQVDNKTNKRKQLSDILFPHMLLTYYIHILLILNSLSLFTSSARIQAQG